MSNQKNKVVAYSVGSTNIETPSIEPYKKSTLNFDSKEYIPFGLDNMFPQAVMALVRKSVVLRGIINRKRVFIIGNGLTCDESDTELQAIINEANAEQETLTAVVRKLEIDNGYIGNAYMEIVTDGKQSFISLYHHDHTTVRKHKDNAGFVIHANWANYDSEKDLAKFIPEYPNFEPDQDGYYHAMYHFKDYEPEFQYYGIMEWLAGMGVGAIAYKTDKWNVSRLDNSFKSSGMLVVDGEFNSEAEAKELKTNMINEYTGEGQTGKVMFMVRGAGGGNTEFIEMGKNEDGDWTKLHTQSNNDLIVANQWFRSLSGLPDSSGFDTERILNEYQTALSTVIGPRQDMLLEGLKKVITGVLGIDTSGLSFVNKPPIKEKQGYMRIWEARKQDGLEFDQNSREEQRYLADLEKSRQTKLPANE